MKNQSCPLAALFRSAGNLPHGIYEQVRVSPVSGGRELLGIIVRREKKAKSDGQ